MDFFTSINRDISKQKRKLPCDQNEALESFSFTEKFNYTKYIILILFSGSSSINIKHCIEYLRLILKVSFS